MLKLNYSTKFKRDLKLCAKRGCNIALLQKVIDTLRIPEPLPPANREHKLVGNHSGECECHITPDWLLVYQVADGELYLIRTGSHNDLFGI